MKKQLIAVSLCLLMLALIPMSVAAATPDSSSDPSTTDIGRTVVRGLVLGYKPGVISTRFFAIRIHFTEITGTETTTGVIRFQFVKTGEFVGGYTNFFLMKGFFTYLFSASFRGGINAM